MIKEGSVLRKTYEEIRKKRREKVTLQIGVSDEV
jgi:hypothetical protein